MLESRDLLNALSMENHEKNIQNHNNDFDFSEVLRTCGDKTANNIIRYPDGQEKAFSFDK